MKFLDTHFEEYVRSVDIHNLHPYLSKQFDKFPKNINELRHLIFYGPPGVGKYSQALHSIRRYSPTELKYERKMNIRHNRDKQRPYNIKISDIHFEVDMSLLGCNAKVLWNYIYYQILDILSTRQNHTGIIICKNFHHIHSELLDVFYSYMQTLSHRNINLTYILLTEHVSFIPLNIIRRVEIVHFRRPTKTLYDKCVGKKIINIRLPEITNIKNLHIKVTQLMNPHIIISDRIIHKINDYPNMIFLEFRELLYDLFIYHIDIGESIWYILSYFIKSGQLTEAKLELVLLKLYEFLKFFNNNYRPIYHLENFMIYLCKVVHEF